MGIDNKVSNVKRNLKRLGYDPPPRQMPRKTRCLYLEGKTRTKMKENSLQ